MLLHRAAHQFALFHLFPARIDKTHQSPKISNHVVTMGDVQSRGWRRVYNFFFSLAHTPARAHVPMNARARYTHDTVPPPQSDRIYIWLGALSLIYRETQFSTFLCPCVHFSTCAFWGGRKKMATSYRRVKAHARARARAR